MGKFLAFFGMLFLAAGVWAQEVAVKAVEVVVPVIGPVPSLPAEIPVDTFFTQVFALIKDFGGFPWWMKVAAACTLLISSTRVSLLKPVWEKLGAFKVLAAPVLALVMGLVSLWADKDHAVTLAAMTAYLLAGGGSIILHQLLDAIKELPFVNDRYDKWIDVVKSFLGAKKV